MLKEKNPLIDEVTKSSINSTQIVVRHNYEIVDNVLQYRLEINPNLIEKYHEDLESSNGDHSISSELVPTLPLSLTERFYFNLAKN